MNVKNLGVERKIRERQSMTSEIAKALISLYQLIFVLRFRL